MRSRLSRPGLLFIAIALAAGWQGAAPAPASAVAPSAFVLDTLSFPDGFPTGVEHVVKAFHDPGDAIINVEWNGATLHVIIDVPTENGDVLYTVETGTSAPFSVGTFSSANVNGCTGSVTVHALEPVLQSGSPSAITTMSASFERTCGNAETLGELRFHSDDPYAAVGGTQEPGLNWQLAMTGAPVSFVGRRSEASSLTLKNLGTEDVTFGAPTFDPAMKASWQLTGNTCTGTLEPGATCSISGTAASWSPGRFEDFITLPVDTPRGKARIFAPSSFAAATFVPIDPVRLVDTRTGLGVSSSLKHGVGRTVTLVDRTPGTPASNIPPDAVAVTGNLIVTKPTSAGYAAMTTTASNNPSIRTLYIGSGATRSNGVITRLSTTGTAGLTWLGTSGSSAHAIFDATGYFVPTNAVLGLRSGNFRPWAPKRVVSTTTGQGISSKLVAGQPRTFNVPLEGVDWQSTAVAGTLTVLNPPKSGFLSIGPAPVTAPTTSSMHFGPGNSATTAVIAKLSGAPDGTVPKKLSITYVGAAGSSVDVLFDIHGTFGSGAAGYVPLVPNRIVDSTKAKGLSSALVSRKAKTVSVSNRNPTDPSRNVPPDASTGWLLFKAGLTGNLWMVQPSKTGNLAGVPPGTPMPPCCWTVRAPAGDRRASSVIIGKASNPVGLTLYYSAPLEAKTHVMFDVTGYFLNP